MSEKLFPHLYEVDEQAQHLLDTMIPKMQKSPKTHGTRVLQSEVTIMLKIAVCDDDVLTVHNICKAIECFFVDKKTTVSFSRFFSGEALLCDMVDKSIYYDAVFLDIGMDGKNGIETAKQLRASGVSSFIVFITALKDYVFDAFEVSATNYLLKPIDNNKLHKTLEKITMTNQESKDGFLIINKNREVSKVAFSAIIYCEVLNHRVFVYEKSKQYEYQAKIDVLEQKLSQDFFRSHRSFIVNLSHVTGYNDGYAVMSSGEKIPIATRRHSDFMKALLVKGRNEVR